MSSLRDQALQLSTLQPGFFNPNYDDIRELVEEEHSSNSWRDRVLKSFHHESFQHFLMFLLICDVMILFIEIFLSAEYPPCKIIERNCISCCPTDQAHDEHFFRLLSDSEHHETCSNGTESPSYQVFCDPHKYPGVHTAHTVLFSLSVTILSIFFIELNATLLAMGKNFFKKFFLLFDYIIVALSLLIEISSYIMKDEFAAIAELLILFRLWRFVRVGHGVVHSSALKASKKKNASQKRMKELICLLVAHGIEIPAEMHDTKEVEDLQKKISVRSMDYTESLKMNSFQSELEKVHESAENEEEEEKNAS